MKEYIAKTMPQQIADLQSLVRIPSVSRGDPAEADKPFGKTVSEALTEALAIAKRLGFERVWDIDGRCGVVEYGEGDEILGVLAHLDVVPAGEGWTVAPFGAEIKNDRIYGRGTLDDKGAAVSALYALDAVKHSGASFWRRVRIILGCDEEIGSLGVERYLEVEGEPAMAFTPDAEYPVVNSEMGILQATYRKAFPCSLGIACGSASNVIPGVVTATLPCAAKVVPALEGVQADYSGNTITVTGRGGHASMPEFAQNALTALLQILAQQPLDTETLAVCKGLAALWARDLHGEHLGVDASDASGRLTHSPDVLHADETGVSFICDCRHPFSAKADDLLAAWDNAYGALGFARTDATVKPGHFIAADSELVSTLMAVYNEAMGVESKPISMGGGTYARDMKNAVAFGIVREGEESQCHMPDESVSLEDLRFNTCVMAEAIRRLATR